MKIYINSARENWVVDRFIEEWNAYNQKQTKNLYFGKKIIWLIAPWTWEKIPKKVLKDNKVFCTIHHIDEDKLDSQSLKEFHERDKYVDLYHAISDKTLNQVKQLTNKKIIKIPFWINQNIWFEIKNKSKLYSEFGLSETDFFVGSFQRDTEGYDLQSPKLSKGPDRLITIIKYLNSKNKNLKILLTGKRRSFIIKELENLGIPYRYFEMASFDDINKLYNLLDLYVVSSRFEGGPQSILECALTKTPIISTDVGIASEILSEKSIFNMNNFEFAKADVEFAYKNVQKFKLPNGFNEFNIALRKLNEN
tara:strand:- start:2395 stop:3318 length:924 start_codon:yes stop_codon:yes gene_type:complete